MFNWLKKEIEDFRTNLAIDRIESLWRQTFPWRPRWQRILEKVLIWIVIIFFFGAMLFVVADDIILMVRGR